MNVVSEQAVLEHLWMHESPRADLVERGMLRVFDHVYVLTGGGPGTTTQFLSLYIYRIGFKFSDLGQASALAVVVMAVMTIFYTLISRFLPADRK